MEAVTYRLDKFEGPLDLLLSLIQKNKVSITDIPIALICDQYIEYITRAQQLDMDIASEFLVMASELMLIKSKMLLPKPEDDEDDPRAQLTDALLRFQQAKEAAQKLTPLYSYYSNRLVKDTDEISVDKTFVADQQLTSLLAAVRRIIAYNSTLQKPSSKTFAPMISKPIIPVEIKIVSIIRQIEKKGSSSLEELLVGEHTLPDCIAAFLGILELIKIRKLVIADDCDSEKSVLDASTRFVINEDESSVEDNDYFPNDDEKADIEV
ncbi:MAG: segregation and condensation protein A [Eubacteriales bacterium]